MDDYNRLSKRDRALNIIIAECNKLKETDLLLMEDVVKERGKKSSPYEMVIKMCKKISCNLQDEPVPYCNVCDYKHYHRYTYRCSKCHKIRELEPCDIELPTEIYYKLFEIAEVHLQPICKGIRKLAIPEVTGKLILREVKNRCHIQCIEDEYTEEYVRFSGCTMYSIHHDRQNFQLVLNHYCRLHWDSDEIDQYIEFDRLKCDDDYITYYPLCLLPDEDIRFIVEDYNETPQGDIRFTDANVRTALAKEHAKMLNSEFSLRLAYIIMCASHNNIDIDHLQKLEYINYVDFGELKKIMNDLESKL